MKLTAMQKLLLQLKDERRNIPMDIEWDRCYQAIEMVIQNIYLPMEKEQIIKFANDYLDDDADSTAEQYYNETFKSE